MTPLLGLLPVFFLLKSVLQQEHVGYAHGLSNLAHDQQNILFINSFERLQLLLRQLLNRMQLGNRRAREERNGCSCSSRTTHHLITSRLPRCSSDTMNVVKRRLRKIEVDDQVHLRDIETTRRHVGAHEHGALRVAELADGGAATTLVQHGVKTDVVHLEDTEQLGKKLRRATGVAEHDGGGLVHDSLLVLLLTLHYNPMRHSVLLLWTMKYTK